MAATAEHERLQWTKVSSRTYERSLDDMEKFFSLAGRGGVGATDGQHWHISVMAKIKTADLDLRKAVPQAWKALRDTNPCLSAVVRDDRWTYTVCDEQELEPWLEESLHFHDTPDASRDVFPIKNLTGRAALHVLLQTRELYLLAPHTHLDGIGAYTAMSNLVQALADVASGGDVPGLGGGEARNLIPPLDVLADIPAATDADRSTFRSMLRGWVAGFAGVKLRHDGETTKPCGDPRILYRPFDVPESRRIVARCKELGLTVTAAVQAAVSTALRGQVASQATVQSAVTVHNVRKWVDKSAHPAAGLVGALAVPVPAVFALADDFLQTARLARERYLEPERTGLLRVLPRFWGNEMLSVMTSPPPPGVEAPSSLGLSSFGIVDAYVKPAYEGAAGRRSRIEVEDAWLGITLYSPDILLHLWTLQGAMRMQCVYNEAYFETETVAALLKATEHELLLGLGLLN